MSIQTPEFLTEIFTKHADEYGQLMEAITEIIKTNGIGNIKLTIEEFLDSIIETKGTNLAFEGYEIKIIDGKSIECFLCFDGISRSGTFTIR